MRYSTGILILVALVYQVSAQDFSPYQKKYFTDSSGRQMPYRMLSPLEDGKKQYPLVIFLHGAFERGDDNEAQLSIGGRFFLRDSIRSLYPAYVVFPQCPVDDVWAYFENQIDFTTGYAKDWVFPFRKEPTATGALLKKLIDSCMTSGKIDVHRIYVAGLSQGGMGVLDLLARYPDVFAAGISICGAGDPATARLFAGKAALWLFHGENDKVVPNEFSKQYYRKLKKAGSVVRFSLYAGVEHNSWINAFAEPDLMQWLFARSKQ